MEWSYKDIPDFYDRVRELLNDTTITDEKMDIPEKAPMAERIIKGLVPNWGELKDTDKFMIFESCIVYQTAIYFETYVMQRQIKRRQTPSINIEYSTSGNIKQGSTLSLKEALESLLTELQSISSTRFNAFRVT